MMNFGMLLIGGIAIYGAYILYLKYRLVSNTESFLRMVLASLVTVLSFILMSHCSGVVLFALFFLALVSTTTAVAYNLVVAIKIIRLYKRETYYEFNL